MSVDLRSPVGEFPLDVLGRSYPTFDRATQVFSRYVSHGFVGLLPGGLEVIAFPSDMCSRGRSVAAVIAFVLIRIIKHRNVLLTDVAPHIGCFG